MSEIKVASNLSTSSAGNEGVQIIDSGASLTRLHYFDGKFLRADALTLEQDYHRRLLRLSNVAGGWGVVHGLGVVVDGARLRVSPGLAITPAGGTVLLEHEASPAIADLIATAAPAATEAKGKAGFADCPEHAAKAIAEASLGVALYEITAGPVERLCGQEEVYGKLCEDACVTDSQAPWWREGLWLRARPIALDLPASASVPPGPVHLRNRVASAYFAAEPWLAASLVSGAGLASSAWCNPASLYSRDEVPLGLLVREGGTTRFVDAWSARRERMDTQARGYWQGRMAMRPWNVFLAQILQFQCQLAGAFRPDGKLFEPVDDDCRRLRLLLDDTLAQVEKARRQYESGAKKVLDLLGDAAEAAAEETLKFLKRPQQHLADIEKSMADATKGFAALPKNRLLIDAGFMELPPAGYLPVAPGKTPVNEPLRRMFGEGVALTFCAARPDYLPHALEEAQHMARISLTRGLDDPLRREEVEVFVPDGEIVDVAGADNGSHWLLQMNPLLWLVVELSLRNAAKAAAADKAAASMLTFNRLAESAPATELAQLTLASANPMEGVARSARTDGGGARLTLVAAATGPATTAAEATPAPAATPAPVPAPAAAPTAEVNAEAAPQPNLVLMRALKVNTNISVVPNPLRETPAALYADFLIAADPFAADEGDELPVSFAFRVAHTATSAVASHRLAAEQLLGAQGDGDGRLVVEALGRVEDELAELAGRVVLHMRVRETLGSESDDTSITLDFPVKLRRIGNARSGRILILPTLGARTALPWEGLWRATPREALFGLVSDAATAKELADAQASRIASRIKDDPQASFVESPAVLMSRIGNYNRMARTDLNGLKVLAKLAEVPAGIRPESAPRLAALNTLALLGRATDDDAFAAVARRRLFPDQGATSELQLRAVHDWVLFRRRRHARCELATTAVKPPVTESFQTWHLRLKTAAELAKLTAAMTKNDPAGFKGFAFERVDVLHYADESATPIEPSAAVLAHWRAAAPAKHLGLARVWESAPATGQGWQNHVRVKRLVEALGSLIEPPGEGVIRAAPEAPAPLEDARHDGGMLLVTVDELPVQAALHVLVRVPSSNADLLEAMLKNDPAKVPLALRSNLSDGQFVDLPYDPATAAPDPVALRKPVADWAPSQVVVAVLRIIAAGADAGRVATERKVSDAVVQAFNVPSDTVAERVIAVPGFVTPPEAGDASALAATVLLVRSVTRAAPRSRSTAKRPSRKRG